jgi:hypothetical protein
MRGSNLCLTLLLLLCAPQAFGFKLEDPEWMKAVTPAGQPCVEMTLAASGRPGLFEKLTLSHQLRFDGVRYQSALSIVELESRLVPKGVGSYEWRTPTGKVILIDTKASSNNWKIIRNVGDGEIAVVGGAKEVYIYRRSRLAEYEKAGVRYFLNLREGVSEVVNRRGVVLVRLSDGENGSQTLSAFGSTLTLYYGENREFCRCSGGDPAEVEFFYDAGLLVGFRQGNALRQFAWGEARYGKYEKPGKKIPPVVIAHGTYKFGYVANGPTLSGTAYSEGEELGTWSFSYKTGLHRITSHELRQHQAANKRRH